MAVLIRGKDLKAIDKDGKPGNIQYGICNENVQNPKIVMGYSVAAPGTRGRRHYHANCSVGIYQISGYKREFIGPDYAKQEIDLEPGDFLFIPQGEIHGYQNLSDTEKVELVFCYTGVSSRDEARTIYVDPPLK